MCDYSLMMRNNRLAVEGEELVAHRFKNGATGLISKWDFECWTARNPKNLWQSLTACFSSRKEPAQVVCIPPGAHLRLHGSPFGDKAVFTQISTAARLHRDALVLDTGETVLVQVLPEGQRVTVLRLSSEENLFQPEFALPELLITE